MRVLLCGLGGFVALALFCWFMLTGAEDIQRSSKRAGCLYYGGTLDECHQRIR
ncbi:MAG TPA: hypothetical protein VF456_15930 [Vicinamibacterales bacterium]